MSIEMPVELEQELVNAGEFPCLVNPRTHQEFFLISRKDFEDFQDYREQQEWHELALKSAVSRIKEDEGDESAR